MKKEAAREATRNGDVEKALIRFALRLENIETRDFDPDVEYLRRSEVMAVAAEMRELL